MAGTKKKVLSTTPDGDEVEKTFNTARDAIVKFGLTPGKLDKKDFDKLRALMATKKANADFTVTFDGKWLEFFALVGGTKFDISSVSIEAAGDAAKQFEVLKKLAAAGLADAPVNPQAILDKQKQISDLENVKKSAQGVRESYTKYTFDTNDPAMYGALENWATKHSKAHYLDFLGDITAKADAQKIFDTYIKKGASKPVNLSAGVAAAIEKDLKAKKTVNFTAAQKEIHAVVASRIVPEFKKEALDGLVKSMANYDRDLATLRKELKAMGGK